MSCVVFDSLCFKSPSRLCETKLHGFGNSVVQARGGASINFLDYHSNLFALQFYITNVFKSVILDEAACFALNLLKRVNC